MNKHKPWPCFKCLIIMESVDEDHCKCPKCGTEVWYEYDEGCEESDEIEELMQESFQRHNNNPGFSILYGASVPGSGSKTKGRNKKHLMQRPSTSEIYRRLCGTKNPIMRKKGRPPKKCIDSQAAPVI